MDTLERERDLALISLENALRKCVKAGLDADMLTDVFGELLEAQARRQRVAELRKAAPKAEKGAAK